MKYVTGLCLLFLVSCGETPLSGSTQLGQTFQYNPLALSDAELDQVTTICNAISYKTTMLQPLVGTSYSFDTFEKSCEQDELESKGLVSVTVQQTGNSYIFGMSNNLQFLFPEMETETSGSMKVICDNLSGLANQISISDKSVMTVQTSGISSADCVPTTNEACIQIKNASLVSNNTYKVNTIEVIKFRLIEPRVGFFTERKMTSYADCGVNQFRVKKVILK